MTSLAKDLKALSSAEEFFSYFGLDYDPRILASSRLHILKRFHDNLARIPALDDMEQLAQRVMYREQLAEAYATFLTNSALTEQVFPRLRQVKGAFVALSSVRHGKK